MAAAQRVAARGDIVLDTATVTRLGNHATITEIPASDGQRFFKLVELAHPIEPAPWVAATGLLTEQQVQPWLLPPVYERLRTGAYGGPTRRTFAVLGDDVNLAARLMSLARSGEIVVTQAVRKTIAGEFLFEPRPPIELKGKGEPIPIFAITGVQQRRALRLQEPSYALPMVGRRAEMRIIEDRLEQAQRTGQIVGITGEAGMGKSRLVAEVIRLANRRRRAAFGGACQSDGAQTSYLVWGRILHSLFDLDPAAPLRKQIRHLETVVHEWAADRIEALPLLSTVLGISIPDNDFTRALEPRFRKSSLEALLVACIRGAAMEAVEEKSGLLFVLEDLHWIDPVSRDLLDAVAQAIVDLPVLMLLAYTA